MDELLEKLTDEIKNRGVISFARFMELALHCPVYGYYEKEEDTVGRKGDFYTNVSVGDLFGKLLAVQFAEWFGESAKVHSSQSTAGSRRSTSEQVVPTPVQLIEAGAHKGELAGDILRFFRESRPALFEALEYWIIEPSERRQQWQKKSLAQFATKVKWVKALSELAVTLDSVAGIAAPEKVGRSEAPMARSEPVRRILFCNELLDAMPVHRWGWDAKRRTWFEWGVTLEGERFVWKRMDPATGASEPAVIRLGAPPSVGQAPESGTTSQASALSEPTSFLLTTPDSWLPNPLLEVLPDGFTLETSPAGCAWWQQAAGLLGSGKLVTMDYGLTNAELFVPERKQGTIRAYRHHHFAPDILADPGQQDLTSHVNFSAIEHCGQSAGLKTEAFLTQAQFLTSIAARIWKGELGFEQWTSNHTRQFQTLTSPEHLGHAFRVLVQAV